MVKRFPERYCLSNGNALCDVTLFTLNTRYLTVAYIVKINFNSMNVICSTCRGNMLSEYSLNGEKKCCMYQNRWARKSFNVPCRLS